MLMKAVVCLGIFLSAVFQGVPAFEPEPSVVTGEIEGEEYSFNGKIYLIGEDPMDYFDAISHCIRYGGKLASLPDDGNVTLDFFRRVGSFYNIHSHFWLDIIANGVQPVINASIHHPGLYLDCDMFPERCRVYSPGPYPEFAEGGSGGSGGSGSGCHACGGGGVLSGSCVENRDCAIDYLVDIAGNNVTYLPFLPDEVFDVRDQCIDLSVDYCEGELSCLVAGLHADDCTDRNYFICEKESCIDLDVPEFDDMPDIEIWEEVFGLENYCGSQHMQLVVNECAVQFLDIRNIRLGNGPENCTTEFPNLLEAEIGFNDTCGGISHIDLDNGYLFYGFTAYAEMGPGKRPGANDNIRRDRTLVFQFSCVYDIFYTAELYHGALPFKGTRKIVTGTGRNQFVFHMDFYETSAFTNMLTPPVVVNVLDYVHVGVTTDMNVPLGLLIHECWASDSNVFERPSNGNYYDLIANGCPVGTDVTNQTTPRLSASFFSFEAIEFKNTTTGQIFIHCRFEICNSPEQTECELPVCANTPVRNKRDANSKKLHPSTLGPFYVTNKNHVMDLCEVNNGGCSHMCAMFSRKEKICLCPLDMELSDDGLNCHGEQFELIHMFSNTTLLVCSILLMTFSFVFVGTTCKKYHKNAGDKIVQA